METQRLKTKRAVAIDMVLSGDGEGGESLFLAVASQGIETTSTVWKMASNSKFALMRDVTTVGATDVIFTQSNEKLYLTFAQVFSFSQTFSLHRDYYKFYYQNPSRIDQFSGNWSLYSVPALVLLYTPSKKNFDQFQLLDIERVISLTNLEIGGM